MPASGKALLFDIDGTLTDTDALHLEAFNAVLGPYGHAFDHARFTKELQGFSNASIAERFLPGKPAERQAGRHRRKGEDLPQARCRADPALALPDGTAGTGGSRKDTDGCGYQCASPECRNA